MFCCRLKFQYCLYTLATDFGQAVKIGIIFFLVKIRDLITNKVRDLFSNKKKKKRLKRAHNRFPSFAEYRLTFARWIRDYNERPVNEVVSNNYLLGMKGNRFIHESINGRIEPAYSNRSASVA